MCSEPCILIVEDDPTTQELLHTVLTEAGYHAISWTRGEGAYELIRTLQPDLVLLDLWLEHPAAGSMVLGLLAVDPTTQEIPVIVCTAFRQLLPAQIWQLQHEGYQLLEKPYQIEQLLTHIHTLLAESSARLVCAA